MARNVEAASHAGGSTEPTKPVLALRPCGATSSGYLAANGKTLNDGVVTRQVPGLQVVQEVATLAHQLEQPAPGTEVLRLLLQMLGEISDPGRKQCDLHLGGTGVAFVLPKFFRDFVFLFLGFGSETMSDIHICLLMFLSARR